MTKNIYTSIKQHIKKHKKVYEVIFLVVIFAFSLALRRIAMKHGFPLLTHPDENTIINPVIKMTEEQSLNPGNFNRPDQILYYLNFIVLNVISFIAYGVNVAKAFGDHALDFYFYSRFMISIMGSLIPVVAYLIGKQFKRRFALPAAFVFALFPLFVEHSVYITPDIPITLFTIMILYFTVRYVNTDTKRYLIFATIFAAINTAEKYPGLISLTIIFAGIAIQIFGKETNKTKDKIKSFLLQLIQVGLIYLLSLFIVAPNIFLEYRSVVDALVKESRSTHLGADNLGWLGNLWFYTKTFYSNINIFGLILMAVGVYGMLRSKQKSIMLLLYGFLYWLLLSVLALHWERWALPMFIAPLFLIAIGISALWEQRRRNIAVQVVNLLLILSFFLLQGIHSAYIPIQLKFADTRTISLKYCEENNVTWENSLFEGFTPILPRNFKAIFTNYDKFRGEYDYIILSSYVYSGYYAEPERYAEHVEVYDEIRTKNILMKRFEGYPIAKNTLERLENIIYFFKQRMGLTNEIRFTGPTIEIYKTP